MPEEFGNIDQHNTVTGHCLGLPLKLLHSPAWASHEPKYDV